ncbi:MAG: hypothetical protein IJC39_02890 [Firmicutes bacterium]|nr:hypothetical protein [Bacillota bacterium]
MDGINNSASVNRKIFIMGHDTSKAVNITDRMEKLDWSQVDKDSFVAYTPNYYGMKMSVTPAALTAKTDSPIARESCAVIKKADALIAGYYDGEMSIEQLQSSYEALAKEYTDVLGNNGYSSMQVKYCAAEAFYDSFRVKLLEEAVRRNNAEGKQYVSDDYGKCNTYSYYNSDYYYKSEKAISAITKGAMAVSDSLGAAFGSLNTKQGLSVVGDDRYDNFNTAWNYSSKIGGEIYDPHRYGSSGKF